MLYNISSFFSKKSHKPIQHRFKALKNVAQKPFSFLTIQHDIKIQ